MHVHLGALRKKQDECHTTQASWISHTTFVPLRLLSTWSKRTCIVTTNWRNCSSLPVPTCQSPSPQKSNSWWIRLPWFDFSVQDQPTLVHDRRVFVRPRGWDCEHWQRCQHNDADNNLERYAWPQDLKQQRWIWVFTCTRESVAECNAARLKSFTTEFNITITKTEKIWKRF